MIFQQRRSFRLGRFHRSSGSRGTINGAGRLAQSVVTGVGQTEAVENFSSGDGNDRLQLLDANGAVATLDEAVSIR